MKCTPGFDGYPGGSGNIKRPVASQFNRLLLGKAVNTRRKWTKAKSKPIRLPATRLTKSCIAFGGIAKIVILQNCQRKPLPSREGMNLAPREPSAAITTCPKNRL